jgi:hypothetical protein
MEVEPTWYLFLKMEKESRRETGATWFSKLGEAEGTEDEDRHHMGSK